MAGPRLSVREKRILLRLLMLEDLHLPYIAKERDRGAIIATIEEPKGLRPKRRTGPVDFTMIGKGEMVPYWDENSYRRSFLGLRRKGLIDEDRLTSRGNHVGAYYPMKAWLTELGIKTALSIRDEVRAYLDEWSPLVSHTTDSP